MNRLIIRNASQLVTCSGFKAKKGKEMNQLGIIENGAVIVEDGEIKWVGKTPDIPEKFGKVAETIDATGKTVLPGFVDSHTHFVFGGYREEEYAWRLAGHDYMTIMEKGGGIVNSVRQTRDANLDELIRTGMKRLDSMLSFGVTTVEGKSGYGLDLDTEIKQLQVMKKLNNRHKIDVVSTFLGAHAVPKSYKGREDAFIDEMIHDILPEVVKQDLADFCDVFCEKGVFSIEQSRRMLLAAQAKGLKSKIHADEIVQLGGAELAAEIGAVSADHLLMASDDGIKAMVLQDVVATLLPGTAFSLKEDYARARDMIDSGLAVALATDFNPGSCFTESIPLIIALATLYMGMSIEETITALTINGAAALDKAHEIGSIDVGKRGDLVIHEFPNYKFIPYHIGVSTVEKVVKEGEVVFDRFD